MANEESYVPKQGLSFSLHTGRDEELLDVTVPESIGSRGGKCFSGVQPDETAKATSDTSCDLVILLTGIYPAGKRLFTTSIT